MFKEQCRNVAHVRVMYGSWIWKEESAWPLWASVIRASFWCSRMYEWLRAGLRKPPDTPNIEKADGGHVSVKLGDTFFETATGKVLMEEGRLKVLPLVWLPSARIY